MCVWLHVWRERWRLVREREGDTALVRMRVWCRHCVSLFRALMQMCVCVCVCVYVLHVCVLTYAWHALLAHRQWDRGRRWQGVGAGDAGRALGIADELEPLK